MTLRSSWKSTRDSVWIPMTATVPNMTIAAPPRTAAGIAATIAAIFGNRPSTIMNAPAVATTKRLLTRVSRTRPTFSAKQVYGNELRTPPSVVARPSARIARAMSLRRIGFSTISPVAKTSPVVSTAVMNMTMSIETIAAIPQLRGAEVERRRDADRVGVAHAGEVGDAEDRRDDGAEHEPAQHRDRREEPPAEHPLDDHDEDERDRRQLEVLERAEVLGGRVAAARLLRGDRQQRDADDRDDRAGHDRREEPQQPRVVRREEVRRDARDDHRAVDVQQAVDAPALALADRDHRR